jgi:energy-coupling factor transport system substrate-specific component
LKKLTRRQRQFLSKCLDLYNEEREPLHYAALAEHLGVGKTSAYEMLRLLEDYGLVQAEYELPASPRGPGRASVVFRPTPLAARELARLAGGEMNQQEWEAVKERVLEQLEAGKADRFDDMLEELLARTEEQHSPVVYAADMIVAIILGLESLQDTAEAHRLREKLKDIGKAGELGLGLFTGLGIGLSAVERFNRRLAGFLLVQHVRFQSTVSQLSDENRRRLTEFAQEVMRAIES